MKEIAIKIWKKIEARVLFFLQYKYEWKGIKIW